MCVFIESRTTVTNQYRCVHSRPGLALQVLDRKCPAVALSVLTACGKKGTDQTDTFFRVRIYLIPRSRLREKRLSVLSVPLLPQAANAQPKEWE